MRHYPTPSQLPSGSWRCQVTKDGKRYSFTADNPAEAISLAIEFRDGTKKTPQGETLGACIGGYIQLRSAVLSPSTLMAYRSYRDHRFAKYMDLRLEDVDRRVLQKMVNEEARKVSAKTVKNAWGLVSASLAECGIDVSGINLPAVPRRERPYLTATEVLEFCNIVRGKPCEIPALLALCSLRRSEIYALTWEDVDLKNKTITVRRAVVKGDAGFTEKETGKTEASARTVPIIVPQLVDALRACKAVSGRVVGGYPNTLYHQINRLCEAHGLPCVGVHGLRHSFASLCHYLGVPEMECAKMGGWSDLGTMKKIYTHLSEAEMTRAANRLADFFK